MTAMSNNVYYPLDAPFFAKSKILLQVLCLVEQGDLLICELPTLFNVEPPADYFGNLPRVGLQVVQGDVSKLTARVLSYLAEAEDRTRVGDRDDIRVAWITVLKASEGHPDPFAIAFWQYFSESPETLIPFLAARAHLNRIYGENFQALDKHFPFQYARDWQDTYQRILIEVALPPKKQSHSVGIKKKEAAA